MKDDILNMIDKQIKNLEDINIKDYHDKVLVFDCYSKDSNIVSFTFEDYPFMLLDIITECNEIFNYIPFREVLEEGVLYLCLTNQLTNKRWYYRPLLEKKLN